MQENGGRAWNRGTENKFLLQKAFIMAWKGEPIDCAICGRRNDSFLERCIYCDELLPNLPLDDYDEDANVDKTSEGLGIGDIEFEDADTEWR